MGNIGRFGKRQCGGVQLEGSCIVIAREATFIAETLMKTNSLLRVVPLVLTLSATSVVSWPAHAQPAGGGATATNPENRKPGARNRAARGRVAPVTPKVLEEALGKPLTEEQKKAIAEATEAYNAAVAKAVGLTPDELKAKVKANRDKRGKGEGAPANNEKTTPPAQP